MSTLEDDADHHWEGARQTVDGYFGKTGERPLLSRIDYAARIAVKGSR